MRIALRHPLDVSVAEARKIQESLRREVREEPVLDPAASRRWRVPTSPTCARAGWPWGRWCSWAIPDLEVLEVRTSALRVAFPYVPGLLSFRELPALLPALEALGQTPDLIFADGQGLAHPRGFGLASHLGVLTGIPTIGCAKSRLVGEAAEPGPEVGDWEPLLYQGEDGGGGAAHPQGGQTTLHLRGASGGPAHLAAHGPGLPARGEAPRAPAAGPPGGRGVEA